MDSKKLFTYITLCLGVFPLVKLNHFSMVMIVWFLVALYNAYKSKTFSSVFKDRSSLYTLAISTLLFWVYLLYFPLISDTKELSKIVVKSLPILIFPFGFLLNKSSITKEMVSKFLWVFIGSTILINCFGWIEVFRQGIAEVWNTNDFYHPTFRTIFSESSRLHIPYLGLLTSFASLLIVYQLFYKSVHKITGGLFTLFLVFSLYIYSARMALGIFLIGFLYILWRKIVSLRLRLLLLVLVPFLSGTILWFSPIKERYQTSLDTELQLPHEGQQPHEVNYRYGIWHCSTKILKQNLWTGVGPDQVQKSLNQCYDTFTYRSYEDFTKVTYNTHNQYMDWMLKFGIVVSTLIFCSLFVFIRQSDILYHLFVLTLVLSFVTENVLDRQIGVVFYSLFNAIFVIYKNKNLEKSTRSRLVR